MTDIKRRAQALAEAEDLYADLKKMRGGDITMEARHMIIRRVYAGVGHEYRYAIEKEVNKVVRLHLEECRVAMKDALAQTEKPEAI